MSPTGCSTTSRSGLKTRGKPILNIPYTQECNDVAHEVDPASQGVGILRAGDGSVRADLQGRQGLGPGDGDFGAPLHHGAPHRAKYFRQIFQKIRKKKDVLFWTGAQIADWFKKVGPKAP